ncbi:hypothetical protein [uncultured Corynebacterium sp.]|uniref:hypothetical protein n=1 Tax=uncultured Corynebacterium sp. TaxID=159447 RepID=UPI0025FCF74F|nr:hypothetical protein [uncultured Corynebacterium sp.]
MFRTNDARDHDSASRATGSGNRSRRGIRTLTASAAAALALTAGAIAPAAAQSAPQPGPDAAPAMCTNTGTTPQVVDAIERAKAAGHIADRDWVSDPCYPMVGGAPAEISAQVITLSGATGSSPQAVLLFDGDGAPLHAGRVPEGYEAHEMFGPRTGLVVSVEHSAANEITVEWRDDDRRTTTMKYHQVGDGTPA